MSSIDGYTVKFEGPTADQDYLNYIESIKSTTNSKVVAGIDEVGRGALFGDVVVACVVLPPDHGIVGITDSKKISENKRIRIEKEIADKATYGIGTATSEEVDKYNILKATHMAALRAYTECSLKLEIDLLLCDGGLDIRQHINIPSRSIVKGDLWNESIGAASIMAKVFRDDQMNFYHDTWPQYGFNRHKGYGAKYHREAIVKYGLTPLHRKTFGICKTIEEDI